MTFAAGLQPSWSRFKGFQLWPWSKRSCVQGLPWSWLPAPWTEVCCPVSSLGEELGEKEDPDPDPNHAVCVTGLEIKLPFSGADSLPRLSWKRQEQRGGCWVMRETRGGLFYPRECVCFSKPLPLFKLPSAIHIFDSRIEGWVIGTWTRWTAPPHYRWHLKILNCPR